MNKHDTQVDSGPLIGYARFRIFRDQSGCAYDFEFLEADSAFILLTGCTGEILVGRTVCNLRLLNERTGVNWFDIHGTAVKEGGETGFVEFSEPLNKWLKIHVTETESSYLTTVVADITGYMRIDELIMAEQVLRREQRLAQNYLDTTETIMVSLDKTGNILMLNRCGLELLGYEADQIIGKNWFETVLPQPEGMETVFPAFMSIMQGDLASVRSFENEVITSRGERRLIAWRNSSLHDEQGRITGTLSSGIDITGRMQDLEALKRSESALKRQNLLFTTLLDNLNTGVFMVEVPGGKPLIANHTAQSLLGRGILPDASKENLSLVYRAHKPGSTEPYPVEEMPIVKGMYGEVSHVDDMIVERPDGTEAWIEIFGTPIRDEHGDIWASLVNFSDITERKKGEEVIYESEKKYRTLFENLSQGIFYQSASGKIIDVNEAALKMFGLSRDQFLGKDSYDARWKVVNEENEVLPPDKHPSMVALNSGKQVENQVVGVYIPETGRYNWMIVNAFPLFRSGEKKPFQVFASMQDITELKQRKLIDECRLRLLLFAENHGLPELLEETLNEAEKLTNSEIGFYHFIEDDQETISLQNWSTKTKSQYCTVEGYGAKYPLSRAGVWTDCIKERKPVVHNDYSSLAHRKGLPAGHAAVIRELVVPVMRSGKVNAILGVGNKPTHYLWQDIESIERLADLAWDIAEKKLAAEALKNSEKCLREMNSQKDRFFSIIAHDLKSPFNSILGFSELLVDQISHKNFEGIDEYAGIIRKSSRHAYNLLVNLLEWSRSQSGRKEFNPEYFELVDFIHEIKPLFDDMAVQKSLTIKTELPVTLIVYADKPMIDTVLRNLVSNAVKFSRQGAEIRILARKEHGDIIISVADNGVGIAYGRLNRLFEMDQSDITVGTSGERGTGLGLLLCKEFVAKHGGEIWADSREGIGSVFSFRLPFK